MSLVMTQFWVQQLIILLMAWVVYMTIEYWV
ncbi:hypothetical protein CTS44_00746 [Comamonas thiooxydans]|nr:hypothetical protein CTS44_00746 [Comamonas thiooxydans]